jgi:hypothetical protein
MNLKQKFINIKIFIYSMIKKNLFFIVFIIFILSTLLFSGCTNIGSNTNDVKRVGNGLEISFSTSLDKYEPNILHYTMTFYNSGKDKIVLSKDNFKLSVDRTNINSIFTKEELDNFYNNIFQNENSLVLLSGQTISRSGQLVINKDFLKNQNNLGFSIYLNVIYNYSSEIIQNVNLDLKDRTIKFYEKVSTAAPIKLTNIKLIPISSQNGDYKLYFYFNSYLVPNSKNEIDINFGEFKLGNENILKNCKIFTKTNDNIFSEKIEDLSKNNFVVSNSNFDGFTVICDAHFNNPKDIFDTQIYGKLKYIDKINIENKIIFPDLKSFKYTELN